MHMYSVGYGSYEDSGDVTLLHEKEFSKAEFDNMAIEAAVAVVRVKVEAKSDRIHGFDDLYSEVAEMMCQMFGFTIAKYHASFYCFGWASVFDNNDWAENREGSLKALTDAINKAGFDRSSDPYLLRQEEMADKYRENGELEQASISAELEGVMGGEIPDEPVSSNKNPEA